MRDEWLYGVATATNTATTTATATTPLTGTKRKYPASQAKILFFGDSNMFGQSHIPDKYFIKDVRYKDRYPTYFFCGQ